MLALKRYPWRLRRAKAREWARRSHEAGGTRERRRIERGESLEAAAWRARQDARGEILRHGVTYSAAHPEGQPWTILRSKLGRVDQVDLHLGAQLVATCGLRTLERGMKRAKL